MISVVVCTFNRAPILHKMLDSFFRQKRLCDIPYELLIVDNNSSDNTRAVVHEFFKKGNVMYLPEASQGHCFARNRGIAESKGEIVSFLDDDVLVHENWLSSLKACFDETHADVVGGRVSLKFEVTPEKWVDGLFRKCLSEVDLGSSRKVVNNGDCLYGANLSFRKKVFDLVGRFDINVGRRKYELVSGDETDMVRRVIANKGKVLYNPDALVEHLIGTDRLQWQYFIRRAGGDGLTQELLEPKASSCFQFLRVCRATVEFLRAGYLRYMIISRAKDSYEQKLAEFNFLQRRSYLAARFARLMRQLGRKQKE